MSDWRQDKQWSDRFLPEIKQILGLHLFHEPKVEEDMLRNTDLTILSAGDLRIGCRVRRNVYLRPYGHQFTIRSDRPRQDKTELSKIIEGFARYLFYGFADAEEVALAAWWLLDLNAFRLWYCRGLSKLGPGETPGTKMTNRDGSSRFIAFRWKDMPRGSIVAQSGANQTHVNR